MRKQAKTIDQVENPETKVDKRKEPKEFEIVRDPLGLFCIRYSAGGELPASLKGKFTTINRAQVAIDNVLAERKQKDKGGLEQQ